MTSLRPASPNPVRRISVIEILASLVVLSIIAFYSYVYLVRIPYLGAADLFSSNVVEHVFHEAEPGKDLQPGDKILKIGAIDWINFLQVRSGSPLKQAKVGETVPIQIERDGQVQVIAWTIQKPNAAEIGRRLLDYQIFFIPIVFWLAGTFASIAIRPRTATRRLLIAFLYFTAVWLAAGAVSGVKIYLGSPVFHWALWVTIPILWHLHWVFPQSIARINPAIWIALYITAFTIGLLDGLAILSFNLFPLAGLLLSLGALAIMVIQLAVHPDQRRPIIILLVGFAACVTPGIVQNILRLIEYRAPTWSLYLTLWSLAFIPLVYLYVFTYRRLGILEIRTNRLAAIFIYGIAVYLIAYLSIIAASGGYKVQEVSIAAVVFSATILGVLTALIFPGYQRWFEQRILGIPAAPQGLLVTYADRILTSLDRERLAHLLRDEALPSLLIRQAALLQFEDSPLPARFSTFQELFLINLTQADLPDANELAELYNRSGQYLAVDASAPTRAAWVRLALPLEAGGRLLGLCLLGRRDPDDYYATSEIPVLQALMDQTALALVNIEQNQLLHSLYQEDIRRHENERSRLALELHDDVLGSLAILANRGEDSQATPVFQEAYQASVQSVRQIISGLRPPLLDIGLRPALDGVIDEVAALSGQRTELTINLPASPERYPAGVELHLYRIIQEACRNAVQSGSASQITISGRLETGRVEIQIADNGSGFDSQSMLDLHALVEKGHFGLAGMYERAALIGAQLRVESSSSGGTQVWLSWQQGKPNV